VEDQSAAFDWELALAAQTACVLEADAPKPGNVNRYHDFEDVTLEDFHMSALAIGRAFGNARALGVGGTVLEAVREVRQRVPTNTNLGILLLLAPLALAWSHIRETGPATARELPELWRREIRLVLAQLTEEDTARVYQAIREASPGGMGSVSRYDVNEPAPAITLLAAMEAAAGHDLIARQYADNFSLVLGPGREIFAAARGRGHALPQAVTETFLFLLSRFPDTLIARKLGAESSMEARRKAALAVEGELSMDELDSWLRSSGHALNPGTTADLVTAVLFVRLLEEGIWR
jgi:triphosphoribosyl-dephospho-CoA synthase